MKVVAKCEIHDHVLDEFDNQNITPGRVYVVIGVSAEYYRVVNDRRDPILYPKYLFNVVDGRVPEAWVRRELSADEYYIDPPELSDRAFWDRFHDGDAVTRAQFEQYLEGATQRGE